MKILVSGGIGYIGSHTCIELLENGYEVVVFDNLYNAKEDVVDKIKTITGKDIKFYRADMRDLESMRPIFEENTFDAVIHFAGLKCVPESIGKPHEYYVNNISGTLNLCQLMNEYGCKRMIFSSSACVYGTPEKVPVREDFPLSTINPYGTTKLMLERILTDFCVADEEWSAVLLRYFNPIGAQPTALIGELPNGVPQNLLPYVTQTAMGIREKLSVFGDDYDTPDGSCIRDYIYVVDLAKAHVIAMDRILNNKQKEKVEVFNIGTGNGVSVLELIRTFEKATGVKLNYQIVGRRAGDIEKVWANPDFANKELGWKAEANLEDTLRSAWNWQLKLRERGIQ